MALPTFKISLLTTTQQNMPTNRRKPSAAARPIAADKQSFGNPPPPPRVDNKTYTHAEKAERSSKAERSRKGGFGVFLGYGNPTRTRAEEGQADERTG
jgi:hypothetical protein